ncbi:TfoX/Sxy family protein [Granulicoccus sp. GXG6511]|uniref:TfoX/Sxy family protein n=1 Tax=Granulicoccus sp. GXG6511 TaxID=3381351 RepID=UPI003D7EEE78
MIPTDAAELANRIRAALSTRDGVREVRMFGALCFMLDGKILVGTMSDGSLLVRIDPERNATLQERPGTSTPEMGRGRSMGPGWLRVEPALVDDDLDFWIDEAIAFNPRAKSSR